MAFREINRQVTLVSDNWLSITSVDFLLTGDFPSNNQQLIHEFINSSIELDFAYKFNNGIDWNYSDNSGSSTVNIIAFGLFSRRLLSINDYKEISLEDFNNRLINLIVDDDNNSDDLKAISKLIHGFDVNSIFYLLDPPESKILIIHPFTVDFYLCGFAINRLTNILTIIQLSDY